MLWPLFSLVNGSSAWLRIHLLDIDPEQVLTAATATRVRMMDGEESLARPGEPSSAAMAHLAWRSCLVASWQSLSWQSSGQLLDGEIERISAAALAARESDPP
ncbi:hypothetical protein [Sorangium sp. So ce861]|uniref:hypothetical protein n=1 Tax=Sorangium sp. So ce861 TaxID=3133323 RepID=UPI003F5EBFC5